MTDDGAAQIVRDILANLGISEIKVSASSGYAEVDTELGEDDLMDALEDEGFDVADVCDVM